MIKINDLELQDAAVSTEGETLHIAFDMANVTLTELEEYFNLNTDTIIERYEGENLLAKWYYKSFQSIGYEKTNGGWHVILTLQVSQFLLSDVEKLQKAIDEKEEALLEIADLVSRSEEQLTETNRLVDEIKKAFPTRDTEMQTRINNLQNLITELDGRVNSLINRVALLENAGA